jgi:F-type H+-transporting ATPase subunit delta
MSYRIASRYAKSLIDLAAEQGKLDRVGEDMNLFVEVSKVREVALLLRSPVVTTDRKQKIFKALFTGKIDALTFAFLDIILKKGRESLLGEIASEYVHQYREIKGISIVELTSAETLSPETLEAIKRKLVESKLTHAQIEFNTIIDPSLIGGFVIAFEDKLYDASVRHQLELLRKEFDSREFQAAY